VHSIRDIFTVSMLRVLLHLNQPNAIVLKYTYPLNEIPGQYMYTHANHNVIDVMKDLEVEQLASLQIHLGRKLISEPLANDQQICNDVLTILVKQTQLQEILVGFDNWTDPGLWKLMMTIISNNKGLKEVQFEWNGLLPDDFVPSLQEALSGMELKTFRLRLPALPRELAADLGRALLPVLSTCEGCTDVDADYTYVITRGIWCHAYQLLAIHKAEENKRQRTLAVVMGLHPRLGENSLLFQLHTDQLPAVLRGSQPR
jgi:hypothetical protein